MATPPYWFRAKRYGWGWGLPLTWQGWAVLAAFALLVMLGAVLFPPRQSMAFYSLYMLALSAALVGVCYLKGEPTKWRWGGK